MTPGQMRDHVTDVAETTGIDITWRTSLRGRARRLQWHVYLPEVRSEVTYALALHELGHVLSLNQRGSRLDKEVDAWRWAEANALDWTEDMECKRSRCLVSYIKWAKRRQAKDRSGRVFITDQHPIWRYVDG